MVAIPAKDLEVIREPERDYLVPPSEPADTVTRPSNDTRVCTAIAVLVVKRKKPDHGLATARALSAVVVDDNLSLELILFLPPAPQSFPVSRMWTAVTLNLGTALGAQGMRKLSRIPALPAQSALGSLAQVCVMSLSFFGGLQFEECPWNKTR